MDENFVYGDDIPYEENIHQINVDLSYSHWPLYVMYYFHHKITIVENGWETLLFV